MAETINDRIEMIVNERFDGNKAAFAKSIGLPPTGMSSYLGKQRRSKPSVGMVAKIVITLDIDARWLLTGEETPKREKNTKKDSSQASENRDVSTIANDAVLAERVGFLQMLMEEKKIRINFLELMIDEKNERIAELKEKIEELKSCASTEPLSARQPES